MDELSFSNGIFDRVLCLGSLEYAEDLDLVISEISRVLKKDGIAIISMQNSMGLYRLWDRFIHSGSWHNKVRKIRGKPVIEGRPEKIVPLTKLRDEFARHNLMIQKVVYYNFNIFVKPFDRLFPDAAVKVSKRLEFLGRTILGLFLAADFLILAEKMIS